jgi:hypothetical protein
MDKKKCYECGAEFWGRADKKFCSDPCRNVHHNKLNGEANNLMRNINNVLRKNRRILSEFNPEGKMRIQRDKLLAKGFNFNYFTNIYRTNAGKEYFFCYDQGYVQQEDGMLTLVVRQEYVG